MNPFEKQPDPECIFCDGKGFAMHESGFTITCGCRKYTSAEVEAEVRAAISWMNDDPFFSDDYLFETYMDSRPTKAKEAGR